MRPADPATGQPLSEHYRGRLIAVGSRHRKETQFRPAFADILKARLVVPAGIDTDQFGTFSGEVARPGSPLDAARAKAALAVALSGVPLGLASEASYGPLPGSGVFGHEEILLFCDGDLGIEVLEGYRSASVPGAAARVGGHREVPPALISCLPGQALIVRSALPAPRTPVFIRKGITDSSALHDAITRAVEQSADGLAIVEPDLRAHHNPSRRRVLAGLARTLALRLATECPACRTPGFGRVNSEAGRPCRVCGAPTPLPCNEILRCCRCGHTVRRPVGELRADPADCPDCNP